MTPAGLFSHARMLHEGLDFRGTLAKQVGRSSAAALGGVSFQVNQQ